MIRPRSSILAALIMALAVSAHAKRAPRKKAAVQPRLDCGTMVDSLVKLYDAGDPAYLTWDFSEAKCDPARLYTAYYYQGIGFLFISAWKEALYFLSTARDIGGPKDEEILYHLWTVYRKLDRYPEMERLTLELHQRYPSSLFLLEILDQWKAVRPASPVAWSYSVKGGWARNPYLDHLLTNRVRGEMRQKRGAHQFRETGSMSLSSNWDERPLQGFQANLGGEYEYKGFSAEANWGAGYESRGSLLVGTGTQSLLVDSNWNLSQGRVALGYSVTTATGWNVGVNGSLFMLSEDWKVAGLSHSQSFLFSDFILIGYIDAQRHWIDMASGTIPEGIEILDGMLTCTFNLTPYVTLGRHNFGAGPTWYVARMHYGARDALSVPYERTGWQHSVSATASYGFDWKQWCRLAFSAAYGFDFDNGTESTDYKVKDVYAVDAGISFSF